MDKQQKSPSGISISKSTFNRPAYPIHRPDAKADDRFTVGLALDVADVLTRHGYPPVTCGVDLLRLQQALFTLIYQEQP